MDNLGDRMKDNYESRDKKFLTRRTPVIIRLDGKAFHTFTRNFERPYSYDLNDAMVEAATFAFENIQGARLAYVQSDEISIFIADYDKFKTQAWFDYNLQKMTSISASLVTAMFNKKINQSNTEIQTLAFFDSRCFNIPKEEVYNYFYWRYLDWQRNSIQLLGQSMFSHKELHKKNTTNIEDMCAENGIVWKNYDSRWINGTFIYKILDNTIKIDRDFKLKDKKDFMNNLIYRAQE